MHKVYILLPVYNRKETTCNFIDCLLKQDYENYHLVLIDDGSTDGTGEAVQSIIDKNKVTIIRGKGKWLWAGGLQKGYLYLKKNNYEKNDYVLIINDDTSFHSNFISSGIQILEKTKKTLLLAENYNYATKSFEEGGVKADWKEMEFYVTKDERELNILSTRGLMMRISDFISLKGFHPLLIPHYLSDYEFSFRAFKKGFTLLTSPDYFLYYDVSATRNVKKDVQSFYSLMKYRLSRKSPGYIIAWTSFVILCCPLKYKIKHLVKLWLFPILYFLVPLKKKFIREDKGFL